jgi:glucose-1-phosphate cytidylyltransferase
VASLLSVPPPYSFHLVEQDAAGRVTSLRNTPASGLRINGGLYVLRHEVLDYLDSGQDLVDEPFERLAAEGKLCAIPYDGFWISLDTLKDLQTLQALEEAGTSPWAVWRSGPAADARAGVRIPSAETGAPGRGVRTPAAAGSARSAGSAVPPRRRAPAPRPERHGRAPRRPGGHPTRS